MDLYVSALTHVIQLAVAPVFLLTSIAGFLGVLSGRLGRIVDRARDLEEKVMLVEDMNRQKRVEYELKTLWRRVQLANKAIGLCTAAGLMVCIVVVGLFVGDYWTLLIGEWIVAFFVTALILLILALILFLKEVQLATRILKRIT
ncbi:DUF2721 domain-containing protein [Aestuariibacter sp. AA17]|uniref:DUF2721 domain-containing protein n=1 Tax=Fluctibacter corallii TaxID=2984329 RepID=A0ABT3ACV7_9ALTE|nr:DUF2721 domain-containing protein [Aestuariibacter sp. AA17]MCV2886511.1 DUF2721 domain-containing protein [Aestuariibacter sp. AA17]